MRKPKVKIIPNQEDPETVYIKKDGQFVPIGKLSNVDRLGYGTWIVVIKDGSRSITRYEGEVPHIYETVIYSYKDEITRALDKWDKMNYKSLWDYIAILTAEIRAALKGESTW